MHKNVLLPFDQEKVLNIMGASQSVYNKEQEKGQKD